MAGIFISYRREDARGDVGRLTDDLKQYLGANQIFRDIDAIEPGMDFEKAITNAVSSCGVLLAVIGPQWLTVTDKKGRRRLEDSRDYVRLEIMVALSRDIRVIPVLVGSVAMPASEDLPAELQKLARRQAHELSDKHWDFDVKQLIAALERIPGIVKRTTGKPHEHQAANVAPTPTSGVSRGKKIAWGVGLTILVLSMLDQCSPPPMPLYRQPPMPLYPW